MLGASKWATLTVAQHSRRRIFLEGGEVSDEEEIGDEGV